MIPPVLECIDDERRKRVRADGAGGIDYVEVSQDQRTITVYFIGAAPAGLTPANVRIEGGRNVRDIAVLDVTVGDPDDEDQDGWADVRVDRPGDYSTYTLRLVALNAAGDPTDQPLAGVDPRYAAVDFSFKASCPSDVDCEVEESCPPIVLPEPEITYLAKDYASFRQLILDRLALIMPDWQERHVPDLGITLVEILAYVGDYLSYFQDAVATEAYLQTARQRISVRRHVRLIDYRMHEGCNARAWICFDPKKDEDFTVDDAGQIFFTTDFPDAPKSCQPLTIEQLNGAPTGSYEVFEPLAPGSGQRLVLHASHRLIPFWTWGNRQCCLPEGAVRATLKDGSPLPPERPPTDAQQTLHLQVGDVLIFEEVKGPNTGLPGDADPSHRQAVRLTKVAPGFDALYRQPVVEIEWAAEDRLRFALCISAIGQPPECVYLDDISVARGNVVLADHGRRKDEPKIGPVPQGEVQEVCEAEGEVSEGIVIPARFRPVLEWIPLTFGQPPPAPGPVTGLLTSDPSLALPEVVMIGTAPDGTVTNWHPSFDLLSSRPDDTAFVVEIDNEGYAHLRFGDGELGRAPESGTTFEATYRTGNGAKGNVGADKISHVVFRNQAVIGTNLCVRNPLAAAGGVDPEAIADVKRTAPAVSHGRRERAITADDYAELAERNRKLQRAAATLSWTGSWYEADVDLDPVGVEVSSQDLIHEVTEELEHFRRIGHDLEVFKAAYVPLDIAMLICLHPHALRDHVRAALRDLFSKRTLPNGQPAFFHPDNLTFGQPIYVSRLIAAAQAVPGVESVTVTRLERLHEGPNGELSMGVLRVGPMEIAQMDNDSGFPDRGRISLQLRGGR
jgi:hypothetical protein